MGCARSHLQYEKLGALGAGKAIPLASILFLSIGYILLCPEADFEVLRERGFSIYYGWLNGVACRMGARSMLGRWDRAASV